MLPFTYSQLSEIKSKKKKKINNYKKIKHLGIKLGKEVNHIYDEETEDIQTEEKASQVHGEELVLLEYTHQPKESYRVNAISKYQYHFLKNWGEKDKNKNLKQILTLYMQLCNHKEKRERKNPEYYSLLKEEQSCHLTSKYTPKP